MKKFLALAALLVTLLSVPLTAGAEKSGWKSDSFSFNKVKVVYLKDLSRRDAAFRQDHPSFVRDEDAVRQTYLKLQKDLDKEGVTLYTNPVMLPDKKLRQTISLQVMVNYVGTEPSQSALQEAAAQAAAEETAAAEDKKDTKKDKEDKKKGPDGTAYASVTFLATKNGEAICQYTDARTSTKETSQELLEQIRRAAADTLTENGK